MKIQRIYLYILGCFLAISLPFPAFSADSPLVTTSTSPSVIFLVPGKKGTGFFTPVTKIMSLAAENLGVQIELVFTDRSPIVLREKGAEILARSKKPDYLILVNDRDVIPKLMVQADELGIKTVLFNGALSEEKYEEFKNSPTALKHWIGGIYPNEEQSGYLVAKTLVEKAMASAGSDRIEIIGLTGTRRSFTTVQRERGLKEYIQQQGPDKVKLNRVVHAYWDKDRAELATKFLLKIYPDTSVIWSASDSMALGAVEGALKNDRYAGKDIYTCGVDWSSAAFDKVADETLSCTVGGHVFDGAWLLVLLKDHFNQLTPEFINTYTDFSTVNSKNLGALKKIMNPSYWSTIDFRKYSKFYGNEPPKKFGSGLLFSDSKLLAE